MIISITSLSYSCIDLLKNAQASELENMIMYDEIEICKGLNRIEML